MLAKADGQFSCAVHTESGLVNGLREQNKSCIGEEIFSRGSKCNNKEYTVLEGSAGRKIISNKNEPKQFKNGKQLTLKIATNSRR